jgi:hypothetical protein
MQIFGVGTLLGLFACGAAAAEGVHTSPKPPSPEKSRFISQVMPDFDAERAVQNIVSPHEHILFRSPTGWRLFEHPIFEANIERGMRGDTRGNIDAGLAIYYHPERDVLCGVDVDMLQPQAARISGFGSEEGVRISPAMTYRIMVRNMQGMVEIDIREYGAFTRFKTRRKSPMRGSNYRQFEWQYASDHDQSLTEGFGESALIKSTIITTLCHWPKGEARQGDEAAILSELRQSYTFTRPQTPKN